MHARLCAHVLMWGTIYDVGLTIVTQYCLVRLLTVCLLHQVNQTSYACMRDF